jgi:glycosyltransferase involved in cell wall biosynthesis
MTAPRILYVVSHWPGAPSYGTQQRVFHIGRLLQQIGRVTVAVVSPDMPAPETFERTRAAFDVACVIRPTYARRSWSGRLQHELDARYLNTDGYGVSAADRRRVEAMVAEHDVSWIQTVRTANRLGIETWPRSVLDVDDIPSHLYRAASLHAGSLSRRLLNRRMQWIWTRREQQFLSRFGTLVVCSEEDRTVFPGARTEVIPNGFTPVPMTERRPADPPRLGFIGNFDWEPNADGAAWFVSDVWPLVKRRVTDVRLRLVGRGSECHAGSGRGIDALGWIDDATAEFDSWTAMIVPIRIGSGTRIKIAEAFARRCPVVSTILGAYGYIASDREHMLLADNAQAFADACVRLIEHPDVGKHIAGRAYESFLGGWTWDAYAERVARVVRSAMTHSSVHVPSVASAAMAPQEPS